MTVRFRVVGFFLAVVREDGLLRDVVALVFLRVVLRFGRLVADVLRAPALAGRLFFFGGDALFFAGGLLDVPPSWERRFFSLMSSTLKSESCLSISVPELAVDDDCWHSGHRARLPSYFIVSRVTALPHSEHDVT